MSARLGAMMIPGALSPLAEAFAALDKAPSAKRVRLWPETSARVSGFPKRGTEASAEASMRHQRIEDIGAEAALTLVKAPTLSRRERLLRWAQLLERDPHRRLKALTRVEFVAEQDRDVMRGDDTPIALAFADPVLRAAGLEGDTFGDARAFFKLSWADAHRLLCDCHYSGRMDGETVARRVRVAARPTLMQRFFMGWFGP
jgi:hypothetical protein